MRVIVSTDKPYRIWWGPPGQTVTIQNNDAANDVEVDSDVSMLINSLPATLTGNGILIAHAGGSYVWPNAPDEIYCRSKTAPVSLVVTGKAPS